MVDGDRPHRARDYTHEIIGSQPEAHHEPPAPAKKASRSSRKRIIFGFFGLLIVVGVLAGSWLYYNRNTGPVPRKIQQQVNFPIYYSVQNKLPSGYNLDLNSFTVPQNNVVLYTVRYGSNKELKFTLQDKPSTSELANFTKKYIPINRQVLTLSGTATEGAIGQQTVVSLPTNDDVWILITGPSNSYGTDALAQVLKSITK